MAHSVFYISASYHSIKQLNFFQICSIIIWYANNLWNINRKVDTDEIRYSGAAQRG